MRPRSFKDHREPDGSWAHIRGAESVTVLEVVWANETPRQMSQELSDYKRKGLNVILINIKWRQRKGEAAISDMPRQEDEFQNWREHATVSVLVQDPQEEEWEVTSFGQGPTGLPARPHTRNLGE
jgi:hypothetical protein